MDKRCHTPPRQTEALAYTRRIKGARIAGAREAMARLVSEMVEAGATGFRDMKSLDRDVKGGHIAEVALQSASTMNRAMDSSSSRCPVAIRKDQSRGMGRPKATSRTVGRALRVAV